MKNRIGRRIAELRNRAGMSQECLAERCGVSRQTISCWENGTQEPKAESLILLCPALNVTVTEFFAGVEGADVCGCDEGGEKDSALQEAEMEIAISEEVGSPQAPCADQNARASFPKDKETVWASTYPAWVYDPYDRKIDRQKTIGGWLMTGISVFSFVIVFLTFFLCSVTMSESFGDLQKRIYAGLEGLNEQILILLWMLLILLCVLLVVMIVFFIKVRKKIKKLEECQVSLTRLSGKPDKDVKRT